MFTVHFCGHSNHVYSFPAYIINFCIHIIGIILVISIQEGYDNVAFWFFLYTILHGVFVFVSSVILLRRLITYGSKTFKHFSFVRNLTSVIFLLAISIFHIHIFSDGKAFIVPRDVQDMSTSVNRLDFLLTSFYASIGILSSVGYGDVIPVVWYARLVILPNFMFTFLVNAMIFSAFTKFYIKSEKYKYYFGEEEEEEKECQNFNKRA